MGFFLFIFCSFLITPAILTVVEKDADVSYFYSMTEEEKKDNNTSSELKELKELPYPKEEGFYISQIITKRKNYHYFVKHHYSQVMDVIIPPPEYIS